MEWDRWNENGVYSAVSFLRDDNGVMARKVAASVVGSALLMRDFSCRAELGRYEDKMYDLKLMSKSLADLEYGMGLCESAYAVLLEKEKDDSGDPLFKSRRRRGTRR